MNKHNVREDMGDIGLAFCWVSTDRKQFKWVNSKKKSERCYKTWKKAIQQMPEGMNYFGVVLRTKDAPNAKSKSTFEVLGTLCAFDNFEDAQSVNTQFWGKSKWLETSEKKEWTREFATCLKNYYTAQAPEDFAYTNYDMLMELTK